MAWNGSGSGGSAAPQAPKKKSGASSPLWLKGALAGVLVVAIGAAVLYMMRPANEPTAEKVEKARIKIKGSTTAVVPKPKTNAVVSRASFVATNVPVHTAAVQPPKILIADIFFECKDSTGRPLYKRPLFDNNFENFVYEVVTAVPGERFIDVELDSSFDDAFAECMDRPLVATSGDSQELQEAKKLVNEVRENVKTYLKEGALPSEVVMQARAELNKIADYRDLLQEEFDKVKATGDYDDVELFKREADKLLGEYHAMPLDITEEEADEIRERGASQIISSDNANNRKEDEQ